MAPRWYHRAQMRAVGQALVLVGYVGLVACGSSEPKSPLILGQDPADVTLGPRTLSASQTRALEKVITSAGETCDSVEKSYLRDIDPGGGVEAWDVRCLHGAYSLVIRADGTPAAVRQCVPGTYGDAPCQQPYAGRRSYGPIRREPQGGPLNPELGKLLAPMTAKDGKTD